jgi:hypothetical protein
MIWGGSSKGCVLYIQSGKDYSCEKIIASQMSCSN